MGKHTTAQSGDGRDGRVYHCALVSVSREFSAGQRKCQTDFPSYWGTVAVAFGDIALWACRLDGICAICIGRADYNSGDPLFLWRVLVFAAAALLYRQASAIHPFGIVRRRGNGDRNCCVDTKSNVVTKKKLVFFVILSIMKRNGFFLQKIENQGGRV